MFVFGKCIVGYIVISFLVSAKTDGKVFPGCYFDVYFDEFDDLGSFSVATV